MAKDSTKSTFSVLMYHAITGGAGDIEMLRSRGAQRYAVRSDLLMDTLEDLKVPILDPANWDNFKTVPVNGVILTFDDSLIHHASEAIPILNVRGIKAVFGITTDDIGLSCMLTWDDVLAIAEAGHTIASHGKTHSLLGELTAEEIKVELAESKRIIEDHTERKVNFLSLPGGSSCPQMAVLAHEAGYKAVFTSSPGLNTWDADLFEVRRFAIRRSYSSRRAVALAAGKTFAGLREKTRAVLTNAVRRITGTSRYKKLHGTTE